MALPVSFEHWPYLGILVWLLAAALGLPIPEDIPLLTSGYLVHRGLADLGAMVVVAMIGVLGGDFVLFGLGRRFGHHIVELPLMRRVIRPSRLLAAERLFQKHGVKIIFAGRFMPGLRPMIFMASGVLKVPLATFAAVNGLAACISVPTLVVLGKLFGDNLGVIQDSVRKVTYLIALGIMACLLVGVGVYLHRRQKAMVTGVGISDTLDAETLAHLPPGGELPRVPSRVGECMGVRDAAPHPEPTGRAG